MKVYLYSKKKSNLSRQLIENVFTKCVHDTDKILKMSSSNSISTSI